VEGKSIEDRTEELLVRGYNCAQAVMMSLMDEWQAELNLTGRDRAVLEKSIIGFGAGMGHSGQVCGAVSGAAAALSLLWGYGSEPDADKKSRLYLRVEALTDRVRERYGREACDWIVGRGAEKTGLTGEAPSGKRRVCLDAVRFAAGEAARIGREPDPFS